MTKSARKPKAAIGHGENLELLDDLIKRYYDDIIENLDETTKLGNWLKMIELRRKLTPDDTSQKELWKLLEKVRRDTLGSAVETGKKKPSPKKKQNKNSRKTK